MRIVALPIQSFTQVRLMETLLRRRDVRSNRIQQEFLL